MKQEKLQCKQARDILITDFLKKSGFSPRRENHQEAWCLSPLRNETHPSFKVSKPLNRWYDHGLGRGGNVIDLVIEMNNHCTVQQALSILSRDIPSFSFQQQNSFAVLKPKDDIKIEKVLPLKHPELISYLRSRKVDPHQAARYALQVYYSLKGATWFAIGLQNVSGGWELRNPYYKNSSSPQSYSLFSKSKAIALAAKETGLSTSGFARRAALNQKVTLRFSLQELEVYKNLHVYHRNFKAISNLIKSPHFYKNEMILHELQEVISLIKQHLQKFEQ